ncbi:MAG: S26 family signal peptidase, partial [Candidatus Babeliales bacterium]
IDPQSIVTTSLDVMDQVEVKDGVILKMPGVPVRHRFPLRTIKRGKSWWNGTDEFYVELDENEVWAMGDNRRGSWDSRFPDVGPIKKDQIHGKIVYRIWSIDSQSGWWIVDFLSNPMRFFKKIRWSRCLNKLV